MKFKPTYTLEDSEVLEITREMGYGEAIEGLDYVASLLWGEDYMNDCFKKLRINDYAVEEAFDTYTHYVKSEFYDECDEKDAYAEACIIKALNEYAKENGIVPNYILVDVSW